LNNVSAYTFAVFGAASTVNGFLLDDTLFVNVPTNNFALRLANASTTAGGIDIYLTAPGADLTTAAPFIAGLFYATSSTFINAPLGNYRLRLTRTGTKQVIFDAPMPSVAELSGQTGARLQPRQRAALSHRPAHDHGAATIINNRLAQFKAINASSVASPLNLFVDAKLTLANVLHRLLELSGVDAGTRTITVEATATPGATLLATSPTLTPATDTSIALYGSAGSLGALVLTDANVSTFSAKAQVRFVNVSPDLASIDVYANGTLAVSGLLQNSASGYPLLDAVAGGTSYQFDFDPSGSTTPALTLPAVTLVAGNVYTIYVMGPASALRGIVVQDF
jgi:hypothetical protein